MTRIVTPEQLAEGFWVRYARGREENYDFVVVRKLPDGNFEVKEPKLVGDSFVFDARSRV